MKTELRASVVVFVVLTVITGVIYPAVVTLVAQVAFSREANGSIVPKDGKPTGSELIGQPFDGPTYFWSRPSATGPVAYNAGSSSGSNLGPTNPALLDAVKGRVETLRAAHPEQKGPVPVDLVTASASGLDPHISPAAAEYQAERVAKARGLSVDSVRQLIAKHTDGRTLGVLGEPRVNVLLLNLALDAAAKDHK